MHLLLACSTLEMCGPRASNPPLGMLPDLNRSHCSGVSIQSHKPSPSLLGPIIPNDKSASPGQQRASRAARLGERLPRECVAPVIVTILTLSNMAAGALGPAFKDASSPQLAAVKGALVNTLICCSASAGR